MAWLQEWSGLSIGIGVILILVGANIALYKDINTRFADEKVFEAHTQEGIKGIELLDKRLDSIETRLSALQFRVYSAGPVTSANALLVKEAINTSLRTKSKLPTEEVTLAGQRFLTASVNDSPVWDTALAFVDYKTSLNSEPIMHTLQITGDLLTH